MKFLLTALNAKYIHTNPALYSIKSYINKYNKELINDIKIVEYTINNRQEQLLSYIFNEKPDVIAFSCYIWNITEILNLIEELHKIMPNLPIWLGGPEVTYHPDVILKKYKMITGIMLGEGEETVSEIVDYYKKGGELSNINGIIYRDNNIDKLLMTQPRELLDLSDLPFLYDNIEQFQNRIIYYESSRGCPYKCNYCLSSIDKTVRFRNLDLVFKELKFFLDNKIPQVKFIDRTFNANKKHARSIWNYILENDNGITNFHFEIASEVIDDKDIEILSKLRPGSVQFEIGVQTTNEDTLREIKRYMSIDRLKEVVDKLHKPENIHLHLDLIAGLPHENYDSFVNSFNEVYSMKPDQLQLGFLKVLKGSEMEENSEIYGLKYLTRAPYEVLYTKWISYEEILKLKQVEEMVELYYNSGQFIETIKHLVDEFDYPFDLYYKLANFYEEKGYFITQPARIYRYDVLLEFINIINDINVIKYKQLMTYDIYSRENVKSRPSFARDLTGEKDKIREFYRMEVENRKYLPNHTNYDAKQLSRMTHIEVFEHEGNKRYVLFDYSVRNPLTKGARVVEIN